VDFHSTGQSISLKGDLVAPPFLTVMVEGSLLFHECTFGPTAVKEK